MTRWVFSLSILTALSATQMTAWAVNMSRGRGISAGYYHTCETNNTYLYCQGYNASGQLGNGTTVNSNSPTQVANIQNVSAIATGYGHSCAIASGVAYCWGDNTVGQLGNGTTVSATTPQPVPSLPIGNNDDIAAGWLHACAVVRSGTSGGDVYCWGYNGDGQLGNGTTTNSAVPVLVGGPGQGRYTAVAVGMSHSCALDTFGYMYCWGANYYGQLGDGTTNSRLIPAGVDYPPGYYLGNVNAMATGLGHTCAQTTTATYCWGYNAYGQLGDGTQTNHPWPTLLNVKPSNYIAAGAYHTCSVSGPPSKGGTQLDCWGYNGNGQLGINNTTTQYLPTAVYHGDVLVSPTAGAYHTCSMDNKSSYYCWGSNSSGQLGIGNFVNRWVPVRVLNMG